MHDFVSKISIDSKDKYRGYTEKKNLHCSIYLDRRWKKYNKSRPHYKYRIIGRYKHMINFIIIYHNNSNEF